MGKNKKRKIRTLWWTPSKSFQTVSYIRFIVFPITELRIDEVKSVISKLIAKKASGYDLITAKILKKIAINGIKICNPIIQRIFKTYLFFKQCKLAEIILPLEWHHTDRLVYLQSYRKLLKIYF